MFGKEERHTVQVHWSYWSGLMEVHLDGEKIREGKSRESIDGRLAQTYRRCNVDMEIGEREVYHLVVKPANFAYRTQVIADGRPLETQVEGVAKDNMMVYGFILLIVAIGIILLYFLIP